MAGLAACLIQHVLRRAVALYSDGKVVDVDNHGLNSRAARRAAPARLGGRSSGSNRPPRAIGEQQITEGGILSYRRLQMLMHGRLGKF